MTIVKYRDGEDNDNAMKMEIVSMMNTRVVMKIETIRAGS
jgi:hypothetical protein